jgi:hypothetical protein
VSNTVTFRDKIPELLDQYSSVEEFLSEFMNGATVEAANDELRRCVTAIFLQAFQNLITELLDVGRWSALAAAPPKFDRELNAVLRKLKRWVKIYYRTPSHRPPKQSERDAQIFTLKRIDASQTFGQIGIKFKMSANAV